MSLSHFQRHLRDRYLERRDPRFEVMAACRFWWFSPTGESSFGLGQTANLGMGGVSVLTSVLPPMGSPIILEIDLPRLHRDFTELALPEAELSEPTQDLYLLLTAEGTVLRHHNAGNGFAAATTQTSFAQEEKRRFA